MVNGNDGDCLRGGLIVVDSDDLGALDLANS